MHCKTLYVQHNVSLLQGSPHMLVSNKDVLSRHDLVNVADSLYHHSSEKISELATALGISAADLLTLKQFCTPEDFPLLILLEWKKRHSVASRPKLASALLACGLQSLAEKLDPNGRYNIITKCMNACLYCVMIMKCFS